MEAQASNVGGKSNCFGVTYIEDSKVYTLYVQVKRGSELFGWIDAIATGKKTAAAATGSDVVGFSNTDDGGSGGAGKGKANPLFGGAGGDAGGEIEGRCIQCGKELPPVEDAGEWGFGDEADGAESKFCDTCKDE